jgi:hypothetical protein
MCIENQDVLSWIGVLRSQPKQSLPRPGMLQNSRVGSHKSPHCRIIGESPVLLALGLQFVGLLQLQLRFCGHFVKKLEAFSFQHKISGRSSVSHKNAFWGSMNQGASYRPTPASTKTNLRLAAVNLLLPVHSLLAL